MKRKTKINKTATNKWQRMKTTNPNSKSKFAIKNRKRDKGILTNTSPFTIIGAINERIYIKT